MSKNGFTLIELLVVVAIIGTLSAVGIYAYSGFIKQAEVANCTKQHNQIKEIIELKIATAVMANGPDIQHSGGNCFQYFFQFNESLRAVPRELQEVIGTADSVPMLCHAKLEQTHTRYADHVQGMGIRNCSNFGEHPYASCAGKECPAIATSGRIYNGLNAHVKGQTILACGAHGNFTDKNKCYLGTKVSDDKVIEDTLRK